MRRQSFGDSGAAPRRGGGLFGNVRWLVLLGFLVYGGCYYLSNRTEDPYTGQTVLIDGAIGPEQERALGLQAYREILAQERPLDPADPASQEIREIASRLIAKVDVVSAALASEHGMRAQDHWRQFEWDVNVIPSEQANAFCLPGGKMAVYTGLIPVARTRDAMAVVMGHEIAHALLRHGAQRMSQQKLAQIGQMAGAAGGLDAQQQQMMMAAMGYGYLLPYARSHETQADEVGLMLAAAACYDPNEAIGLWERMGQSSGGQAPPEFSSTHPNPGSRIQNLQALMPKALEYRQRFCAPPPS
ncbi:peptidase [Pseudoxanthomonas broegbernensis]|uniref:Peptidase n=1 Tax=Pseudoxanthomonas broegbernensis TaxID=83619 RepID=A0A7V8GPS9_9GAMM|nr:M48 family metallopeptidase [Pseudoxanthomonas broegbernensis]KAF1687955.1 peptidase [Pseudoxanthomonas broegbernensis]MBB6064965.1 putative Zn-dependent protease [Pseudoxanthomonas broegbernensis]